MQLAMVADDLIDTANRLRYLAHLTADLTIARRLHEAAQSVEAVAKNMR